MSEDADWDMAAAELAAEERRAKRRAEEAEAAAKLAENDRLAYLRRTGRTEMKP